MNPNDTEQEAPIRELRDQERATKPDFLARVRNRIQRRTAAAQIASYSWNAPRLVLIEMASMLGYIFRIVSGNRR